ncbi:MAG: alanine--tRNA ligase [Flavobacteriales bacterium]|nr:alanine--tRNA ligase [Flavobacteriales bacterium]
MKSADIRQAFLDFMKSRTHRIVDSAPMVIQDDPTLMFTNAGMNQFKDIFLGNSEPKHPRVANSQKCLRVSGKHNDLEEVGVDTYHHTMFEMLGNWSFGDYFKEEAIDWAWELLTDVYGIEKERLYITVFGGDEKDGLEADQEARTFWQKHVPNQRILDFDRKDNFWEMGETGPCGPCSEIHIDLRSEAERKQVDGATLVNLDDPRVIEIWNLVFMEFNRKADSSLHPLPHKHIDTGMGFERLATVLQGKTSNYDTDIFQPLIQAIEKRSGKKYQASDSQVDIALRVIADHVRAVSFSIADGQLPSNTGAGYVIRRILRRAVRYAYSFLEMREPFIHELVAVLVTQMGEHFTELKSQEELISKVIKEEEESFLRTLSRGMERLETITSGGEKVIPGEKIFELYDTYGFPVDLTALILREQGLDLDEEGFKAELEKQKARSRKDATSVTGDWVVVKEDDVEEFVGYDQLEADVHLTRYREVEQKGKTIYQLVFNYTPFYPEGGGQVGDTGTLERDGEVVRILDTKKENNLIIHFAESLPKDVGSDYKARVDAEKRQRTERNHSVTHLLHKALREILGDHVQQKGSLVHPDYLRFDFSHFSKVEDEQVRDIEVRVNELIMQDDHLDEKRNIPLQEALDQGALALFGEKYGDTVRAIRFGESMELCGGTHVSSTGTIGLFKITQETSVAAGIRRIEAKTAQAALAVMHQAEDTVAEAKELLKNPDLTKAIQDLIHKNQALTKEIEELNSLKVEGLFKELKSQISEVNGVPALVREVPLDAKAVKDLVFRLKDSTQSIFMVFGYADGPKAGLTVAMTENLVKEKGWNAGQLIRDWAKEIEGGGGGQPFLATAGGKKPEGIASALNKARVFLEEA